MDKLENFLGIMTGIVFFSGIGYWLYSYFSFASQFLIYTIPITLILLLFVVIKSNLT